MHHTEGLLFTMLSEALEVNGENPYYVILILPFHLRNGLEDFFISSFISEIYFFLFQELFDLSISFLISRAHCSHMRLCCFLRCINDASLYKSFVGCLPYSSALNFFCRYTACILSSKASHNGCDGLFRLLCFFACGKVPVMHPYFVQVPS